MNDTWFTGAVGIIPVHPGEEVLGDVVQNLGGLALWPRTVCSTATHKLLHALAHADT